MAIHSHVTFKQKITFCSLWVAYGSTYLLRKPFGFLKEQIMIEYNIPQSYVGYIDFCFLLPYCFFSLFFSGLVDRIGPHITLCMGLVGSSFVTLMMFYVSGYISFLLLLVLSGSFQAFTWPACVTLLSSWFHSIPKPTLFGWFGTTCFFGSLMGSFLPVIIELVNENYRMWKSVYIISSFIVFTVSLVIMLIINPATNPNVIVHRKDSSCLRVFMFPCVKEVGLVVFFIKSVRYTFMFWLPYYLIDSLGYTAIAGGLTSASFDVGGMIGSIAIGIIIEKYMEGNELKACMFSIFGSVLSLVFFFTLNFDGITGWIIDILWLTLAGALNCAPDAILTGSVASKLGELHGAPSGVIGVINGMGSSGTVIEGVLIAYMAHYIGLQCVIPMIVLFSLLALHFASRASKLIQQEQNSFLLPNFS